MVKDDRFVVTRADATGFEDGLDAMCIHEFKTKWTTSKKINNLPFRKKPLPRDLKQSFLNCLMLAHARSASRPWDMVTARIHYVKPSSEGSQAITTRHTASLGSRSTTGAKAPVIKNAAINALARCTRYSDTHFVCKDVKSVIEELKVANPDNTAGIDLMALLDIVNTYLV